MELTDRLNQIKEYGLPYTYLPKHNISSGRIAGFLSDGFPEIVVDRDIPPILHPNFISDKYSEAMSHAIDNTIPANKFRDGTSFLRENMIEIHAIYDPERKMTHYFALPALHLLENI